MDIKNYVHVRIILGAVAATSLHCFIFAHNWPCALDATYRATPKPHNSYNKTNYQQPGADAKIRGEHIPNLRGIRTTTKRIMQHTRTMNFHHDGKLPISVTFNRCHIPQDPNALYVQQIPCDQTIKSRIINVEDIEAKKTPEADPIEPHTYGISFLGGTLSQVSMFPPDSMGAVGPKQYIVIINGLIKSFDKNTGQPDGVLNTSADTFFDLVNNDYSTSDPRIRFDRHSGRWFIVMINVENPNNRIMIAVSDTGFITQETGWTFFYLEAGPNTFFDSPTIGIDPHALYIGGVTLSDVDTGEIFVVNKRSLLSGSAYATVFHNIINPATGQGPYAPCGVDNFDVDATYGYFIGVNNATFGTLIALRVNNPDSNDPTISGNISVSIPTTQFPVSVAHAGNANGNLGNLDGNDDRITAAHIRHDRLWTAHAIGVDNTGACSGPNSITRNASRWYEIDMTQSTPELVQVGTLFAPSKTNSSDQRSYWVPTVMTNGQGHMALCCSSAGSKEYINAITAGRFTTDPLGTLHNATLYTSSSNAYNPAGDPGSAQQVRRWGTLSCTCVDPYDDMTMWTIQEYCNGANSWGSRVVKLIAPPPAKPISANPSSISRGRPSVSVTIKGEENTHAAYFDPGIGFNGRLSVLIGGNVMVNNVTYVSPTELVLDLSTVGATTGLKNVTIRNPDGQSVAARLINIL